ETFPSQMISKWTLQNNEDQKHAFTIIIEHRWNDLEQMLMFITGIRGSGKSHLIQAIVDVFAQHG
ncbi:hypothetical protein F5J12DRAFT_701726, partial [Pisolithus orientalis]|uniref:uncharacterized protein n=1 Tax=Pisolithus orientalis TaxID=936130 RepID=UPI0022257CA1